MYNVKISQILIIFRLQIYYNTKLISFKFNNLDKSLSMFKGQLHKKTINYLVKSLNEEIEKGIKGDIEINIDLNEISELIAENKNELVEIYNSEDDTDFESEDEAEDKIKDVEKKDIII